MKRLRAPATRIARTAPGLAAATAILLALAPAASAHRFSAGVLTVRADGEHIDITLRATAAALALISVKLPVRCHALGATRASTPAHAALAAARGAAAPGEVQTRSSRYRCSAVAGATLALEGLNAAGISVVARVLLASAGHTAPEARQTLLTSHEPSLRIGGAPSTLAVGRRYLALGVEHILLGVDHLAFVACLLLLVVGGASTLGSGGRRRLVYTISAFTLGHSVTLSFAALGLLRLPSAPTEALIALSIVLLAREALRQRQGCAERLTLAQRRPWVVAAAFGLLHGLGFAGALREIGLPATALPLALLSFNLGVELGQLAFIVAVSALAAAARRASPHLRSPRWASGALYAVGCVAGLWLTQRVVSIFAA